MAHGGAAPRPLLLRSYRELDFRTEAAQLLRLSIFSAELLHCSNWQYGLKAALRRREQPRSSISDLHIQHGGQFDADLLDLQFVQLRVPDFLGLIAGLAGEFPELLAVASDRPLELEADALEQYEILLEEQTFPFEEKAIDLYKANADRARIGVYDEWVQLSFERLARLMPARYAKQERSEDVITTLF